MSWTDHIEVNPEVKTGRPVVKGTRITVEFVLGLFAQGWSLDEILTEYPTLTPEGVAACLELATDIVAREKFFSLSVT
jgi:uncharacterized protein (DUF433 family)